jgi:hypothetical protein
MSCFHFPNGASSFSNTDSTSSIFYATTPFSLDYRLDYPTFLLILKTADFWTFACNLKRDFKSKAPNCAGISPLSLCIPHTLSAPLLQEIASPITMVGALKPMVNTPGLRRLEP